MFTGICQAILPLALRRLHRKDDLQRACLLIETLARHWRDPRPLELLIVAPARDEHFIRARLPRLTGVNVTVRPESDFFSPFSRFFMLTGWFRQQIVKLYVPSKLGFAGYLTLDSDVVCVGDFDAMTFVHDGRALSRWEPKGHHDWWRRAARMAGVPYDAGAHGLSVTPNILHGDLATQALAHFHNGAVDAVTMLAVEVVRRLGTIPWTEYSLYTSVAERNGNLLDYHVHWDPCYCSDTQLFSERSCVWEAADFERLARLSKGTDPGGKFIIVQSRARIPVEQVRAYCLGFAAEEEGHRRHPPPSGVRRPIST